MLEGFSEEPRASTRPNPGRSRSGDSPGCAARPTRVLVLADSPVVRRGVSSLLGEMAGMQTVGAVAQTDAVWPLAEETRPDAVVVELPTPCTCTLNICREVRRRYPTVAMVTLSTSPVAADVNEALAAGVRGYLMLNTSPTLLGWAILAARGGRTVVDPQIPRPVDGTGDADEGSAGDNRDRPTIDIACDVQDVDATGWVTTHLDEARDPSLIVPDAIVVAGAEGEPIFARVVDIVGDGPHRTVHLDIRPGAPAMYLTAAARAGLTDRR